jgi:hypothetical protein
VGKPKDDSEAGLLEAEMQALRRTLAEASVRLGTSPQVTARTRTSSQRASPTLGPKPERGCVLIALIKAEAKTAAVKKPVGCSRPKL